MAASDSTAANVRRIAILVTSLDAVAARQLLLHMPAELAKQVRRAMASLGRIDPHEQQKILSDFRRAAGETIPAESKSSEVASRNEMPTYSTLLARPVISNSPQVASGSTGWSQSLGTFSPSPSPKNHVVLQGTGANQRTVRESSNSPEPATELSWKLLKVDSLAHLLRGERAAVVAVVVSQLNPASAVELMNLMPAEQHREILMRLGRLEEIDEGAMTAIDDHLAGKLKDYHHQLTTTSESLSRVEGILLAATPEVRQQWILDIAHSDKDLAGRLGLSLSLSPTYSQTTNTLGASLENNRTSTSTVLPDKHHVQDTPADPVRSPPNRYVEQEPVYDNSSGRQVDDRQVDDSSDDSYPIHEYDRSLLAIEFEKLLDLPLPQLATVLNGAESEAVLLALAGASPAFINRFLAMLDKQDARDLQKRLRNIGPMSLRDIDEAQRQLVELAIQLNARTGPQPTGRRVSTNRTLVRAA